MEEYSGTPLLYEVVDGDVARITGCSSPDAVLEIPASVGLFPVREIAPSAFSGCVDVKRVVIPEGVTAIGDRAFERCVSLEQVELPASVRTIGRFAFMGCALSSFEAPEHLECVENKAFYQCPSLAEVRLNEGLRTLGEMAFDGTAVADLHIPASVEAIGPHLFGTGLAKGQPRAIDIDSRNAAFASDGHGGLYERTPEGLRLVEVMPTNATEFSVAPNTTSIGPRAFAAAPCVETVVLPEGLVDIDDDAFRGCTRLAALSLPSTVRRIGANAFSDTALKDIALPAALEELAPSALVIGGIDQSNRGTPLKSVTVDPGNGQFELRGGVLCQKLENGTYRALMYAGTERDVVLDDAVSEVGEFAFTGATGIRSLVLNDTLAPYEPEAFMMLDAPQTLTVANTDIPPISFPPGKLGRTAFISAMSRRKVEMGSIDSYLTDGVLTQAGRDDRSTYIPIPHAGSVDGEWIQYCADEVLFWIDDAFERARRALDRLESPYLLADENKFRLEKMLHRDREKTVDAFIDHTYAHGFEQLLDQGYVELESLADLIDQAGEKGQTAAVAFLLDMKNKRFGASTRDWEV